MMKKGITTAYPCHPEARDIGMTLREHFAGLALQGLCSACNSDGEWTGVVSMADAPEEAVKLADALLEELEK